MMETHSFSACQVQVTFLNHFMKFYSFCTLTSSVRFFNFFFQTLRDFGITKKAHICLITHEKCHIRKVFFLEDIMETCYVVVTMIRSLSLHIKT